VGGTDSPPGPYRIEEMAGDALALMDHLGWPDAHVAGVSMGGMIAQELALAAPGRVRSLALLATAGRGLGWKPSPHGLRSGLMVIFGRGESRLHALLEQLLSAEALKRVDRDEATRRMADRLGPLPPPRTFLAQYAAVLRFRSEERLGELDDLPTLVVQPGRDRVIHPGESERLAGRIPGARLVCFPGSGHGVIVEEAAAVSRLLLAHFRRADGERGR
jgi:pimeloyl-ACP methyl ester carboxylesterase